MEARQIPVQLRRDPREIAERHSQANPLTLSCTLARSEEVDQNLSLYAELHASRTPASVPLAAVGPVAMTTGGTGPWELDFTSAQMNQTVLPGEDVEFWLVVYATSATAELFTLATIRLTLQYDNISQVIPPPPEPSIAGNVFGPASSTDNALARFNGTTGKLIQNSAATLTDAGLLTVSDAAVTGTLTASHIHGNLAGAVYSHVRNESGGTLTKGTPVYITGFSVGQSRPLVAAANAASAATMPAIGILDEDLANNASGHAVILGTIENFNTAGYTVNAPLYVASGGGLTSTAPSVRAQSIAIVERVNANNGAIIVTAADVSGSMAQQSSANVSITGGSITGITDLALADGGTGASDAAGARANLQVPSITDLDDQRVDIQTFGGPSSSGNFTWTKPAGAKFVIARIVGSGAGGVGGLCRATSADRPGGAGGGAGTISIATINASELGSTVSVVVGAGGSGGAGSSSTVAAYNAGTTGAGSSFGSYPSLGGSRSTSNTAVAGRVGSVLTLLVTAAYGASGAGGTGTVSPAAAGTGGDGSGTTQGLFVSGGGGGGGGAPATGTTSAAGGAGGGRGVGASPVAYAVALAGGTGGTTGGTAAGNGLDQDVPQACGTGGGGGFYISGQNGGSGGNGGWPGGGGGGGGAADSGFTSGSGGSGANGMVQVITFF